METSVASYQNISFKISAKYLLLLTILVSGVLAVVRFNDIPVGSFWDDAHYIILAESLADGTGYRLINLPGAPVEEAFPPGYPLLLAPLVTLFPENFLPLKLLSLAFWLASLPLLYRLFWHRLPPRQTMALVALVALNPFLVGMATTIMSEAPFLFCSLLALNLLAAWEEGGQRPLWQQGFLLGALLASLLFTVLLRTIGITLVGGIVLYMLLKYGRGYIKYLAVLFIAGSLLLVPLAWFNAGNGGALFFSPLYFSHVQYVSQQFFEFVFDWQKSVQIAPRVVASALIPVLNLTRFEDILGSGLTQGFVWATLLTAVAGFFLALRRFRASDLYVMLYAGLLYFWIVYTAELRIRLLLPILPFLYLYLLLALRVIIKRLVGSQSYQSMILLTTILLLLVPSAVRNAHEWQEPLSGRLVDLSLGTTWLKENSTIDADIMTPNPLPDYLYMHRQTVAYPSSVSEMHEAITMNGIDYVLVRQSLQSSFAGEEFDPFTETLLAFLQSQPQLFTPVYQNYLEEVYVYQVTESLKE